MSKFTKLACQHVQDLTPYQSARRISSHGHVILNANEAPKSQFYFFNSTSFNRYPECQPFELTQAMADYVGVNRDQVLATRGADEGISLILRTFCEIGEGIVIAPPTYGMYEVAAKTNRVNVHYAQRGNDSDPFFLNAQKIKEAIDSAPFKVKAVFIDSPANPLGSLFTKEDTIELLKSYEDILIVIDEAYIEYAQEHSMVELLKEYDNLVILRTLSKAFGLAGIRCGYTLAHKEIISLLTKVIDPYPIPDPVAQVGKQTLAHGGIEIMQTNVKETNERKETLFKALSELDFVTKVYPSYGNFLLVEFKDAQRIYDAMMQKGIILRSFAHVKGLENTIRITIGTAQELDEVMRTLVAVYENN